MVRKFGTRYQAAILRDDHVLLLKVHDIFTGKVFWLIPGGGRHDGESEEACVVREAFEETRSEVEVVRLLLDEPAGEQDTFYSRQKTYLCRILKGEPAPGGEPEVDNDNHSTILEVGWFDLRAPKSWDPLAAEDAITGPRLHGLRAALGYDR